MRSPFRAAMRKHAECRGVHTPTRERSILSSDSCLLLLHSAFCILYSCSYPLVSLLLNASSIPKTFGAVPLFRDVSLTIQEGDRLGIVGPNGSGKSTLLQIFAGTIEPDTGEMVLRGGTRR